MKKNYTFLEAILYVCFMPSIKKIVLPLLIVLSASLTVFVKIMESDASTTLVKENIFLNNELNFENTLQAHAGSTNNIGHTINELVAKGNIPEGALYSNLIDIEIALEQMSPDVNETSSSVQYAFYVNLLKRKLALYKSMFNAQQINNIEGAARIIGSPDLRNINDSLKVAAIKLKSDATALSAAVVPTMNVASKKVQSWGFLVYLFGIIFCLLVYLYVYVKGRLSSESETKVKASAAVKENFLANMSHEIRTPLNAILGFTSILQKTKLENEQKDYVDIIQRSGDNLLSIVNDILDLSKIEAGMLRIEEAPFRVSDIISTVETMLSPRAEEKNLKLFVNLDVDVPEIVSGDAVRLTQILVNLVSNSIKFTEDGGVYLRVTMLKMENNTAKLEFLIRDTGIGIPAEKQLTIFDRFEQAEAETTRRFGGTGLGLSIVKNLVELQKGTITLFSNEGHGSSFTVELSFKICEGERTVREIKRHVAISDNTKSGIRILIAEDNSMNQRLIRHLLKSRGYNFDLVFNGVQAIESLKKQSYDMVLMDIQMPEMDGYSATRQIREELKSTIPVIAMTAHAMSGEKEKCIKSGMNDYISKPINEEILFDVIQKYSSPGSFYSNESQSENNGGKIIGINGNDNNAQAV